MEIKVGDKFKFTSKQAGLYNILQVENINDFRPLDMKYALSVEDMNGNVFPDYNFQGDQFFEKYADQIEYLGNVINDYEGEEETS